jgi:hypothetical protein
MNVLEVTEQILPHAVPAASAADAVENADTPPVIPAGTAG